MMNHMVQQDALDRLFAAIGELAEPFGITVTGMAKHVRVLEDAGLVVTDKVGRARVCRLGEEHFESALAWISFYQRLWERRLDGLEAYFTLRADEKRSGT